YGPGGALARRLPRHLPRVRANQTAHWGVPSGRRSGPLRRRGAGAGGDPGVGGKRRGAGSGAGDGATVKRRARSPTNVGIGLAGTVLVHVLAGVLFLVGAANARKPAPPTYRVHLVAAPAPTEDARKAPEAVERPAEAKSPKSTVAPAPPPPVTDNTKREAAPRTTPKAQPLPGERPSTGSDPLTVSTEGIEFPFPEYTNNIIAQIAIRWQRPQQSTPLDAEIGFLVHRDGSISDMQFIKRSGSFGFDLEAQGAIEEAGRRKAFGPLPDGWTSDVLFVRFYFSGKRQ